jgi:GT2 family glycosyltransferase/glycosyltransferase involved in cell wall biosynthesis
MNLSPRPLLGRFAIFLLKMLGLLLRRVGARGVQQRLMRRLVRRTGMFDAEWYLQQYPDVAASGMKPLKHFVWFGDVEGRSPRRLFEPSHYRAHVSPRCPKLVNSLLHYAWVGRYVGASTSPWFDAGFYLHQYRDVKYAKVDPLRHFLLYGWKEGRQPIADFDRLSFLRAHPDHDPDALAAGRSAADAPQSSAPSADEWQRVQPLSSSGALVDVIVPVYKGYEETLRCIHSVLRYPQKTPFELIVIHDDGPEPVLADALRGLAARGLFTLLENAGNQGFVRSVNRGMRLHPARDVVLLNADAEPFNDWLDRLRQAAHSAERVASVTPLSNNATICSYPAANRDNPGKLELEGDVLDALAAQVNPGLVVQAPTGVGFCMYIRRAALDALGHFDEQAFGQGYGEENDFCQRAAGAGWQNLIAADTYVWHWGSTSFGGTRHARVHAAMQVLSTRYPRYHTEVTAFIRRDPLAEARQRLDQARLRRAGTGNNVLIVTHGRGGGTEKFVRDEINALRAAGRGVFELRSMTPSARAVLGAPGMSALPNLQGIDSTDTQAFAGLLADYGIREVRVHQLVDYPESAARALREAIAAVRDAVLLTMIVHDYYPVCPRINLVDETGVYCGEPREGHCNRCLTRAPRINFASDILRWRTSMRQLYELADAVVVPDDDVRLRLANYFPGARFEVVPHEVARLAPPPRVHPVRADGIVHVVAVGAIGNIKGYDVLVACAREARARQLPIRFTVMGFSRDDHALAALGVRVTGRYEEQDAVDLLTQLDPAVVWLPSVWPETYSYTLSIALAAGLPVAAFDMGAIASRLRSSGHPAVLMPTQWARAPHRINDRFVALAAAGAASNAP